MPYLKDMPGVGGVEIFLMEWDADENTFAPRFTFNDVKAAIARGNAPYIKGSSAIGSDYIYVMEPVLFLQSNSGTYSIESSNVTCTASYPDVFMTIGII